MFDIVEIDNRTFTQILDIRSEGRMFSDFEVAFVVRVQEISDLCEVIKG